MTEKKSAHSAQISRPEAEIRLEKLRQLKKRGINPYPSVTPEHLNLAEARIKSEGEPVAVCGRIGAIRSHGKLTFLDLLAEEEKLQLCFKSNDLGRDYELLELLDHGDYIWAKGKMFTTKTGELSLQVSNFMLLAKALLPIPEGWYSLSDVDTRYRQRALDFKINSVARQIMRVRAKVIGKIRNFLEGHGFIEITTPVLQPIPGGAAAKPFVTHYNALDSNFYLRISDELYLKRLIVGGFERVYEIGPDFRNEGFSHMHNPEFTMCEFYWAYQTHEDLMKVTQELVQELVKTATGSLKLVYQKHHLNFSQDFAVKKYAELIKADTGIDIEKAKDFDTLNEAVRRAGIVFENQQIKVWNEMVDELFKKVSRPKIIQPTFVVDYPITTAPLAKRYEDRPEIAQKFQLIAGGGLEIVNAYSELNDPLDQEERFKEQMKMRQAGWDEAQMLDENYIEALKFGMPPTAGWGMGIERIVMLLTDQYSIKEVIPFPTLRPKEVEE